MLRLAQRMAELEKEEEQLELSLEAALEPRTGLMHDTGPNGV